MNANVSSVLAEFPQGDPGDEAIVEFLGSRAGHKAIWITTDIDSQTTHAKLIMAQNISVLWIYEPRRSGLHGLEELLLLTLVLPNVQEMMENVKRPVYLQASLKKRRPKLQPLRGSLFDAQLTWGRSHWKWRYE